MLKPKKELVIVAQINDRIRIIEGPDGVQWAVQSRAPDGIKWIVGAYCRTRKGIQQTVKEYVQHDAISFDPVIVNRLASLKTDAAKIADVFPEFYPEKV